MKSMMDKISEISKRSKEFCELLIRNKRKRILFPSVECLEQERTAEDTGLLAEWDRNWIEVYNKLESKEKMGVKLESKKIDCIELDEDETLSGVSSIRGSFIGGEIAKENLGKEDSRITVNNIEMAEIRLEIVEYPLETHQNLQKCREICRKTLVLDLDETLVHSDMEEELLKQNINLQDLCHIPTGIWFVKRPYLQQFLESLKGIFEIVVYTASDYLYSHQVINIIDPYQKYIQHLLSRTDCLCQRAENGKFVHSKTLNIINRHPRDICIVDDRIDNWLNHIDNLIPIPPFYGNKFDDELLKLGKYLIYISSLHDCTKANTTYCEFTIEH